MYCASKAAKTTQCTVHCDLSVQDCETWNRSREEHQRRPERGGEGEGLVAHKVPRGLGQVKTQGSGPEGSSVRPEGERKFKRTGQRETGVSQQNSGGSVSRKPETGQLQGKLRQNVRWTRRSSNPTSQEYSYKSWIDVSPKGTHLGKYLTKILSKFRTAPLKTSANANAEVDLKIAQLKENV